MLTMPQYTVEEVLPHDVPFILLDDIIDVSETGIRTSLRIAEDCLFFEAFEGVPSWVGAEYMAQCVGAFAGHRDRCAGSAPQIGFLVGVREMICTCPHFKNGALLIISAEENFNDGVMGVFDCTITEENGDELARAKLSVYRPKSQD